MSQYDDQGTAGGYDNQGDDSMGGQDPSQGADGAQGQAGKFPHPDIAEQYYNKAVGNNASTAVGATNGGPDAYGNTGAGQSEDDGAADAMNGAPTAGPVAKHGKVAGQHLDVAGHPVDNGIMKGPHGHDVYAAHLPHWTHQRATDGMGLVVGKQIREAVLLRGTAKLTLCSTDHGWDPSHTKALGHIATFAFSSFGRYMGFC
jgi:hypothetical protein